MASCLEYRATSYVSKEHKKSHEQSILAKMKDNTNNTLVGFISTEPCQMDITINKST